MSQSTPTSVNRGAANLTQVDQYLTAAKRLGIPTSATDNLAATTSPQNTAKILYNTTLNKLRVYNPVTETWRDAIEADLTDYYTKEEIDILLGGKQNTLVSGTNIKTINGETLLGSGNIDIEGALYTATNGITISGSNVISPVYGTTAGTIAQGNDSRIINGQTAYEWGDHAGLYLPLTGGTVTGTITAPTFSGALSGNATTATRLATERTINGTSFNGSTNIVTSSWGSGRNITIGDATKYVNGSTNISWSLSEIGALPLTGGAVTGVIKSPAPVADEDLANKAYVDSKASPFNIIDVTQAFYTDKAINVIAFDNQNNGVVYQEGAIDFGVTRNASHTMGLYAFKQGIETTASGIASSAFGSGTTSTGYASVAFGEGTTASGIASTAFGNASTASAPASSAFGDRTEALSTGSAAFGSLTTASGEYSSAFGDRTTASGNHSAAFGGLTTASGSNSIAFGNGTTASGIASTAFGNNSIANEFASLAIGQYSTDGPVETEWTIGSPIFKVGNGDHVNRSNAYVLYNDGRSEQIKDVEVTEIGQGFVLKSPDGTRWRITVDNSGNLTTTSL